MFCSTTAQVCCCIFNLLFSYGNFYLCILCMLKYIMMGDVFQEAQYNRTIDTIDTADAEGTHDILFLYIFFLYWISHVHAVVLSYKVSRHIGGIMLAIHAYAFGFMYIIIKQVKTNDCDNRHTKLLLCSNSSNSTEMQLVHESLDSAAELMVYFMGLLVFAQCLLIFTSTMSNIRDNKYYFYEQRTREFFAMLLFYNVGGGIYIILPIIIVCMMIVPPSENSECGNCNVYFSNVIYGKATTTSVPNERRQVNVIANDHPTIKPYELV